MLHIYKTILLTTLSRSLSLYLEYVRQLRAEGRNIALMVAEHTAKAYGFASLEEAEVRARRTAANRL